MAALTPKIESPVGFIRVVFYRESEGRIHYSGCGFTAQFPQALYASKLAVYRIKHLPNHKAEETVRQSHYSHVIIPIYRF
jgi:hypothetical protein